MNRIFLAIGLLGSALLTLTVSCGRGKDAAQDGVTSWPSFDRTAAWEDLNNLVAFGSRAKGMPGHRHAANYLASRLRSYGLTPSVVTFTNRTTDGEITFNNIEAVLSGGTGKIILLTTHYDARQDAPADFQSANSSASGPAVLLELARILATMHDPEGPEIRFVFFDGMEPMVRHGFADGLQGSKNLVRRLDQQGRLKHITAMINLDMVGDRNLTITLPRNVSIPLRKRLLDAAHQENARNHFRLMAAEIGDDHDPFHERDIPAINLIDFEYGSAPGRNDYWRTPEDTLDKLSPESLDIAGRVTLRLVRNLISESIQMSSR